MTDLATHAPPARYAAGTLGMPDLDADLRRALRLTSAMRQCFYLVVLLVALAGQVSGAVHALHVTVVAAVPAVTGLELGGVVVLANADVRRRLGEQAVASRLLSALIAAGAVAFNWLAHGNHLLGGFFAGMSALGYLVWLMHTENQRRDRLRATGALPPTTPGYEVVQHWLAHPLLTLRAKSLAKANPGLGLYSSLSAARDEMRRERRQRAISTVLHRKIRAVVDPVTADIAVAVYDLDEIAARLAAGADYDTLTALIGADLAPARLAADQPGGNPPPAPPRDAAATAPTGPLPAPRPAPPTPSGRHLLDVAAGARPADPVPADAPPDDGSDPPAVYEPVSDDDATMYATWRQGMAAGQEPSGADLARATGRSGDATGAGRRAARRYRDTHARAGDDPRRNSRPGHDELGAPGGPRTRPGPATGSRRGEGPDVAPTGATR
jgi:hypothetical protein